MLEYQRLTALANSLLRHIKPHFGHTKLVRAAIPDLTKFEVRREPRDLYDLWTLAARNLISDPWEIARPLQTKLESREGRAEDDLEELLRNAEAGLRARWGSRLGQQVNKCRNCLNLRSAFAT